MHGLGNDFVIINLLSDPLAIEQIPIQQLSHRHIGIGFDQLLLLGASNKADFSCRIFNSDGSEAEQCGNGMRCLARFIHEKKLIQKKNIQIETKAGIIETQIQDYAHVSVNMGIPKIAPSCELTLPNQNQKAHSQLSIVNMGNPHAILRVDSLQRTPVDEWGPFISKHELFPQGTNVGFMEILDRKRIQLRTFERGAGETLACGSNACAAVIAGIYQKKLDESVKVELVLGQLQVNWTGNSSSPVILIGPAEHIFEGMVLL